MAVSDAAWHRARTLFTGFRMDDSETGAEIRRLWQSGYLADPHSAIGIAAARAHGLERVPMIATATAHPAKFPDAMEAAIGQRPPLPPRLADLYERTERYSCAPADLGAVEAAVRAFSLRNAA